MWEKCATLGLACLSRVIGNKKLEERDLANFVMVKGFQEMFGFWAL
jgi:hypothetical protein